MLTHVAVQQSPAKGMLKDNERGMERVYQAGATIKHGLLGESGPEVM